MMYLLVFRAIVVLGAMAKSESIDGDLADVGDKIYHVVSIGAGILRASPIFGHSRPL
jgi:hypothetical protein